MNRNPEKEELESCTLTTCEPVEERKIDEILEALAADTDDMPVAYMNVCVACTEDYT